MSKRKLNLKEANQINGKIEEEQFVPNTLDQLWGTNSSLGYNTTDLDEYKRQINSMTTADIREEAVRRGLMPSHNLERTKTRLVIEFQKYINSCRRTPVLKIEKKDTSEIEKIMSEVK